MALTACKDDVIDNTGVTGVELNKAALTLVVGADETLEATVSPADATNTKVSWTSSDPLVATVEEGKVEALKEGTATITVTTEEGGFTDECVVTVTAAEIPVTGVTLDRSELTLTEGGSDTLVATVEPGNATNQNVTWTSSDPLVATVVDGNVEALTAGTATITVTTADGPFTDECVVTVEAAVVPVTGVTLDRSATSLRVGASLTLTAEVLPAEATEKGVSWSSDNESVATVDDNGVVTALALGEARITVTTDESDFTDECIVTVRDLDVYIGGFVNGAGTTGYNATYWKNGVANTLSTERSYIKGMYVTSDDDVYSAGFESDHQPVPVPHAVVWKNNEIERLTGEDDIRSEANAVFVSGGDVYVAGYVYKEDSFPCATLWKNGVATRLSEQYSQANAVFVSGGDVYVVGFNSFDTFNSSFATIWKNGEITQLATVQSAAFGVYVSGTDVHVAGTQSGQYQFPLYWKNGEMTQLYQMPSAATSIFVEGDDVYVGGTNSQQMSAVMWKNGTYQQITSDYQTSVNALSVFGGDVYAAGSTGFGMSSGAGYWKNGVLTRVGSAGTVAYAIFVN